MKELSPELINGVFVLGGAFIGASLTGIISWIHAARNRSRSELSIFASRPKRLIEVDSSVSEIVEISMDGEIVPSIYTLDIRIANTGTELLNDGAIRVEFAGQVKVLGIDFGDLPAGALDAFEIEQISQQCEEYLVHFKYINPGEELEVKVLLNAKPLTVTANFRQPGVNSLIQTDYDPLRAELFEKPIYDLFRQNWILHSYLKLVLPQYKRYLKNLKENDN